MSSLPKLACICCTYLRPQVLSESIECFLRQDYPRDKRELIILDDAGQYEEQEGDGWRIMSVSQRFRTLGEKRNASAALVSPDVDAYAVWDDDDIYLPWHLRATAHALQRSDWTLPRQVFVYDQSGIRRQETDGWYHPAWGFTRELFERADGYPWIQSGQDQGLARRFKELGVEPANPLEDAAISLIYRWFTTPDNWHLSAMGKGGYEKLADRPPEFTRIADVRPGWTRDWVELIENVGKSEDVGRGRDQPR